MPVNIQEEEQRDYALMSEFVDEYEAIEFDEDIAWMMVMVKIGDAFPEFIFNHRDNFAEKMKYYKNTYTQDLKLIAAPDLIKITGYVFAETMEDIINHLHHIIEEEGVEL